MLQNNYILTIINNNIKETVSLSVDRKGWLDNEGIRKIFFVR